MPAYTLTTTALDCSGYEDVELRFWRWLNVERSAYDHAYLQVSNNGSSWTTIWENDNSVVYDGASVADNAWVQVSYDISSVADDNPTVYVRWIMGPTDGGWRYSGWNIDDIQLLGTPIPERDLLQNFPMDADPGWTTQGQWEFGVPEGGNGDHGRPDPNSAYTGSNVYGYNLSGGYTNDMSEHYLTTTAIDCSICQNTQLRFWRWLNVERSRYDHAYVRVSTNGTSWTTVWENSDNEIYDGASVADNAWVQQAIDISSVADGSATLYIRWVMGETDGGWTYSGWNIDDVQIWATASGPTPTPTDTLTPTPTPTATPLPECGLYSDDFDDDDLHTRWHSVDINSTGGTPQGSTSESGGQLVITSDGSTMWDSDDLRFVYQRVPGDFAATVQIVSSPDANEWSKAGLVVRAGLGSTDDRVMINFTRDHGLQFGYRLNGNNDRFHDDVTIPGGLPVWVGLRRESNTYYAFYSTDGANWTQVASVDVNTLGDTPFVGMGVASYADNNAQSGEFDNFTLCQNDPPPTPTPTVAPTDTPTPTPVCATTPVVFETGAISSYSNQDEAPVMTIEDGGATLHLVGNAWKKLELSSSYSVTVGTVLEFDFRSLAQGEIHAIGFDENDDHDDDHRAFQLYGTQGWGGLGDFNDYADTAPEWKHYVIPVGDYYTGVMDYLVFVNDDAASAAAYSWFRNVRFCGGVVPPTPTPTSTPTATPTPPEPCTFFEVDGQVVIEAEHFLNNVPQSGPAWQLSTDQSGYSVWGYMESSANPGTNYQYYSDTDESPYLDYSVYFSTADRYYVWVRGWGISDSDDSIHAGLDGVVTENSDRINNFGDNWSWHRDTMDGTDAYLDVDEVGLHTFNLFMREDGFRVDKVVLTTDDGFTPSDTGPVESFCCEPADPPPTPGLPPGLQDCSQLLQQGNFEAIYIEAADGGAWYLGEEDDATAKSSAESHSGNFSLLLRDDSRHVFPHDTFHPWAYQLVTLPSEIVTDTELALSLYFLVEPQGTPAREEDVLYVKLREASGEVDITSEIEIARGTASQSIWQQFTVNLADHALTSLADYAGEEVQLYFHAPNDDGNGTTEFYLDDVRLDACTTQPIPEIDPEKATVGGDVRVLLEGRPTEMEGVTVWAYRTDGGDCRPGEPLCVTYSIHDSTYHFYNIEPGPYAIFAEVWVGSLSYTDLRTLTLAAGDVIEGEDLLLQ
jgi:hypothetical protein